MTNILSFAAPFLASRRCSALLMAAGSMLSLMVAPSAHGADFYYNGSGFSPTPAAGQPNLGVQPGPGDNVYFSSADVNTPLNITLVAPFNIFSLTFRGVSPSITINGGGNDATLYGGGITVEPNAPANTLNVPLNFTTIQQINNNSASAFTLGSALINGANSIFFNGTGTGTINVNSTVTGTGVINVIGTAPLGGIGNIGTPVNIGAGATIAPGDTGANSGIGTLTIGSLNLDATSTTAFQLQNIASYDRLVATTTTNVGGTLSLNFLPDFVAAQGDIFQLISAPSGLTGNFASSNGFDTPTDGQQFLFSSLAGAEYIFEYDVTPTSFGLLVVVPEPSRAMLLVLAGVGMMGARRRRRA